MEASVGNSSLSSAIGSSSKVLVVKQAFLNLLCFVDGHPSRLHNH